MTSEPHTELVPVPGRRITAAEFYRMPVGPPYFQLVAGELIKSPTPDFYHQEVVGNVAFLLHAGLKVNRLGKAMIGPSDVQLDEFNILEPDVYYIRRDRMGIVDEQGPKGAPDLVIEVISADTISLDLGPKKSLYSTFGVEELWAIYPASCKVEVHLLHESELATSSFHEGESFTSRLFPGLEIQVSDLFESIFRNEH